MEGRDTCSTENFQYVVTGPGELLSQRIGPGKELDLDSKEKRYASCIRVKSCLL